MAVIAILLLWRWWLLLYIIYVSNCRSFSIIAMLFRCGPEKEDQPYLISILRLRRTLVIAVARLGRGLGRVAAGVRGLLRSEER